MPNKLNLLLFPHLTLSEGLLPAHRKLPVLHLWPFYILSYAESSPVQAAECEWIPKWADPLVNIISVLNQTHCKLLWATPTAMMPYSWQIHNWSQFCSHQTLHCRSSLQILFNFCSISAVKSLQFLVEFGIPFVNVVNICILIMCTSAAVLRSLLNPRDKNNETIGKSYRKGTTV